MIKISALIRGELAALRSLDAVLKGLRAGEERRKLRAIRDDHRKALDLLKRFSPPEIENDEGRSDPWARVAEVFARGASFFGNKAALRALKLEEERGVRVYQAALKEENIDFMVREIIRAEILPRQEEHLELIEKYL